MLTTIAQSKPADPDPDDSSTDDEGGGDAQADGGQKWNRKASLKERGKSGGLFSFVHAPMSAPDSLAWLKNGGLSEGKFLVRLVNAAGTS